MTDAQTVTITWHDREIAIRRPSAVQLAVWQRIGRRFSEIGKGDGPLDKAEQNEMADLLDRVLRIINSLFTTDDDKQWFEDVVLDGTVTDDDLLDMLTRAVDGLTDAKKATGAKKAVRRASA